MAAASTTTAGSTGNDGTVVVVVVVASLSDTAAAAPRGDGAGRTPHPPLCKVHSRMVLYEKLEPE